MSCYLDSSKQQICSEKCIPQENGRDKCDGTMAISVMGFVGIYSDQFQGIKK
jgi:hypothetical protein